LLWTSQSELWGWLIVSGYALLWYQSLCEYTRYSKIQRSNGSLVMLSFFITDIYILSLKLNVRRIPFHFLSGKSSPSQIYAKSQKGRALVQQLHQHHLIFHLGCTFKGCIHIFFIWYLRLTSTPPHGHTHTSIFHPCFLHFPPSGTEAREVCILCRSRLVGLSASTIRCWWTRLRWMVWELARWASRSYVFIHMSEWVSMEKKTKRKNIREL
jgi:hypothetical protein